MSKQFVCMSPNGEVYDYTIRNSKGMEATVLNMGGIIQSLLVPVNGELRDVVIGFDLTDAWLNNRAYFGAMVGRNSNRIVNVPFMLGGREVVLTDNNGGKQLHGGFNNFSCKVWNVEEKGNALVLTGISPDGEEGFPGNVELKVTYTLEEDNALRLEYEAKTDRDTVINLTNHSYFSLGGGCSVAEHSLWIAADYYTEDEGQLPTGRILPVAGTCYDFRTEKTMGRDMDDPMLARNRGFDINFCLNGEGFRKIAELKSADLTMEAYTDTRCVQLYSTSLSKPMQGKKTYEGQCFVCLETQGYPDCVHHENFPSNIVKAGETYTVQF